MTTHQWFVVAVAMLLSLTLAVWFFVAMLRVKDGRAGGIFEGLTPQWVRDRRLIRQIHERHGR
ncbi:hypothetical protein [Streptomyces sp. NBC_00212]|uniref:hypothetical protein n=1 Tax=Streptomyces sp. NBC_00212 TaxID=2975684 RepID=UPI002F907973